MTLALRFAARELRSGVRGFRIFLACLALGVAALAATGSTAEAFRQGLAAQSRAILGGDVEVSVQGRRFTAAERRAFSALGRTTDILHVRAMAEPDRPPGPGAAGDGGDLPRRLAEIRGVDAAWPLAGTVGLAGSPGLAAALAPRDGRPAIVVAPALLDRLGLHVGDTMRLGDERFVIGGALTAEPDALSHGFALGPSALVTLPVLEHSGFIEAGVLFGEQVRIALRPGESLGAAAAALRGIADDIRTVTRDNAAAGLGRLLDQLRFFLGFIGLASLLAGGLGVSTAVAAFLETRRPSIAVMKTLGASAATIRAIYLLQVATLASLGIAIGLAAGAASPFLLGAIAGNRLPIPVLFAVYPRPLLIAAAFGALSAACFSLGPIARARATPPASLFRADARARLSLSPERIAQGAAGVGLVGLTIATAPRLAVAAGMIGAIVVSFALLLALGWACALLASEGRRFARGAVRMGLANLGGPASAARIATPAIGLAVGLLAAILLIEGSLVSEVRDAIPRAAPSLILTEIPPERVPLLRDIVGRAIGPLTPDRFRLLPFVTGRIVAIGGKPIDKAAIGRQGRWAFDADIGMTSLGAPPPDAAVTAGMWWPAAYAGPPLVILDARIAGAANLQVGDGVTLSILGRDLDARIAALRDADLGHFGTSFAVVVDPAALAGAGLRDLGEVRATPAEDAAILHALGRALPTVNVVDLVEQLAQVTRVFGELAVAVRAASLIAGLAGALVLVGAIASTAQARAREAAILKVLGAGRRQIVAVTVMEYGAVGVIAGTAGIALGALCALPVIVSVFHTPWYPDVRDLGLLLGFVTLLCAASGLGGAVVALLRRPAPLLRGD